MTRLKELKDRYMQDPDFREEYARADEEHALIACMRSVESGSSGSAPSI